MKRVFDGNQRLKNRLCSYYAPAGASACAGTQLAAVGNALPRWLADGSDDIRLQAVKLLPDFPGPFSEDALRERAADPSPKVRAGVADAIGNGKIVSLLPTLKTFLSDGDSDVHTAAGNALLQFEVGQVGDLLKANLNDEGFRPGYLCKLAETGAGPWLTNLVEVLEFRRTRVEREVEASGIEPKANYLKARMALTGTYFHCWNTIYDHLRQLPAADFAESRMNRVLDALEKAGTTGSQEPTKLYELYRLKGLNQRAARFRGENGNKSVGYDINQF